MSEDQSQHPQPDQLAEYGLGKLGPDEAAVVEEHVESCDTCCQALETLQGDDFIRLLRDSVASAESQASSPADEATVAWSNTDTSDVAPTVDLPADGGETKPFASHTYLHAENLPPGLVNHPRYRVLELLGTGGMGAVYKAEHKLMERTVALKVINPRLTEDSGAVERFQREVKAAALLAHPNIVTAHDAEQVDNLHLLVMEYVEGTSLAEEVGQQGPLPVSQACDYAYQAALGLQHALECGMVHRDIKPHNLMLTAEGQVKILDFGLAQLASDSASLSGLTAVGTVMGTVDYMAPEQAEDAHSADIRADIYSLGCTLHCLLTGRVPFPEGSIVQKLKAHADREMPSVSDFRDDVPAGLAPVLARMTAKDPADRYQTPQELAEALARISHQSHKPDAQARDGRPVAGEALRPPGRRIRTLVAAAALLLLGAVVFVVTDKGTFEIKSDFDDVQVVLSKGGDEFTVVDLQTDSKVRRLPSGEYEVSLKGRSDLELDKYGFTLKRWGTEVVTVKRIEPPTVRDVAKPPSPTPPSVTPLELVRTLEGHVGNIGRIRVPGGRLAVSSGGGATARLWDLQTGDCLHVFHGCHWIFDISPDGSRLVAVGLDRLRLRIWNLKTYEEYRSLVDGAGDVGGLCFSPDGRFILATSTDGTARYWDLENGKLIHSFPLDVEFKNFAGTKITSDGRLGVVCPESQRPPIVCVLDLEAGKELRRFSVAGEQTTSGRIALSSDARTLLVPQYNNVAVCDLATGDTRRVFANGASEVAFLPDDRHAVCGGGLGVVSVWDTLTGQRVAYSTQHKYHVAALAVTPDENTVLSGLASYPKPPPLNEETLKEEFAIRVWRLPESVWSKPKPTVATKPKTMPQVDVAPWSTILPAEAPPPAIAPFDAATAKQHQEAWAEYLGEAVEEDIDMGAGVKLTMPLIPPGEFLMGSTGEEQARFRQEAEASGVRWLVEKIRAEGPQHRVRITEPFRLSRCEVTLAQFRQFTEETGYRSEAEGDGKGGRGQVDGKSVQDPRFVWSADPGFEQTDNHPVVNVSWNDAVAFCRWLSDKAGSQYMLPTEAQWEYACRAGTTTAWHCGDSATTLEEYGWLDSNSDGKTHPVGQLKANGWSLYDMHGNVREWCADLWTPAYYAPSPRDDLSGPPTGTHRVYRGGNWQGRALGDRSPSRWYHWPPERYEGLGFRVAVLLADATADVASPKAEAGKPKPDQAAPEAEAAKPDAPAEPTHKAKPKPENASAAPGATPSQGERPRAGRLASEESTGWPFMTIVRRRR